MSTKVSSVDCRTAGFTSSSLEAADVGQTDVEDHQRRRAALHVLDRLAPEPSSGNRISNVVPGSGS